MGEGGAQKSLTRRFAQQLGDVAKELINLPL
jgi:hypothetical protein